MTFDPYLIEYRHCINGITKSDAKNLKRFPSLEETVNKTTASQIYNVSNLKVNKLTPTAIYLEGDVNNETIRFMTFPSNNVLGVSFHILEKFTINVRYDGIVFNFFVFDAWENRDYSKTNSTVFTSSRVKDTTYTYTMYLSLMEFYQASSNETGSFNVYIDKITNSTGASVRTIQEVSIGNIASNNKWGINYYK